MEKCSLGITDKNYNSILLDPLRYADIPRVGLSATNALEIQEEDTQPALGEKSNSVQI